MAQFLRPTSDVSTGLWTTAPLWSSLDESTPSDTDFATSNNNTNPDTFEVALSDPGGTPDSGTVTLRVRRSKSATGGHALQERFALYQGGTLIQELAQATPDSTAWATVALTITNRAAITDWTDLRVRVSREGATGGSGGTRRSLRCSWVELEAPNNQAEPEVHNSGSSLSAGAAISEGANTSRSPTSTLQAAADIEEGAGSTRSAASGLSAGAVISATTASQRSQGSALSAQGTVTGSQDTERGAQSSLAAAAGITTTAEADEDEGPEVHNATSSLAAAASVTATFQTEREQGSGLAASASVAGSADTSRSAASALAAAGLVSALPETERSAPSQLQALAGIATAAGQEGGPENHASPSRLEAAASVAQQVDTERSRASALAAAAGITTTRGSERTAASALAAAASLILESTSIVGELPARFAARVALWAKGKATVAEVAEVAGPSQGNMIVSDTTHELVVTQDAGGTTVRSRRKAR